MVDINFALIFATIINFLILLVILKVIFWDKITTVIERREDSIKKAYTTAMEKQKEAENLTKEKEKDLIASKEKGRAIIEENKIKAQLLSKDITDKAHEEAKVILERAQKDSQREKEKLRHELKKETIDLATAMSTKALGSILNEDEHKKLINDFLSKVGD